MLGRFFQRFQQRIECRIGEHMNLVDDIHLPGSTRRSVIYARDNLFTNVIHARSARCVKLIHIRMSALRNSFTFRAGSIRLCCRPLFAKKRLSKDTCHGGFARTTRATEQICVRDFTLLNSVFKGSLNMFLSHHILKSSGAIFTI